MSFSTWLYFSFVLLSIFVHEKTCWTKQSESQLQTHRSKEAQEINEWIIQYSKNQIQIQYIRPKKQLKSSSSHFESLFFMICFQKWAQSGTSLTSLRRNRPIQSLNPCKFASISSSNGTKAMPTTSQIPRWQVGWNTLPPIMVQSKMGVSPIGSLPFKYCAIFHFQLWGKEEVYNWYYTFGGKSSKPSYLFKGLCWFPGGSSTHASCFFFGIEPG